jgi:hypothetical protein
MITDKSCCFFGRGDKGKRVGKVVKQSATESEVWGSIQATGENCEEKKLSTKKGATNFAQTKQT